MTVRVLVLSSLYPPHALGGYEMSCADVMSRFAARGHDVTVLTTDTRLADVADEADVADVAEPQVRRQLRWYWRDHQIVQPGVRARLALERHNRATLQRTLREVAPDVVSVWSMGAMSLGLVDVLNNSGVPVLYAVCDEWPVYGPRLDGWLAGFTRRRGRAVAPVVRRLTGLPTTAPAPRAATFGWLSRFVRDRALEVAGWQPAHETVTYSGIDPADFPLTAGRETGWRWRLLCVGRVEPRKGFATAVEALATLPAEATLRIAGPDDGSHTAELTELAQRLGVVDRVTFGAVPRSELRRVYADADALLFTSAWQEPFGLVPVEAMASGTPVAAAATGGAKEFLVDGGNCLVVPARDPAALAAAVCRLADDAALRTRLVAGGHATAGDLSVDALADVMEQWHLAAAARFADGEPAHRPAPGQAAAS
ncbi:MAG: glycogen synthase [Frankiaceae bacterium]|nr:glycogen synthase [Frankiaceae bacterium]